MPKPLAGPTRSTPGPAAARTAAALATSLALAAAAGAQPTPASSRPAATPVVAVVRKMRETIPQYESIAGLLYKIYALTPDGRYGGLYLWSDRGSADSWFSPEWFARVERERKTPAEVRFFEAPVVLDNTPGGTPASAASTAVVSLVLLPIPSGATRQQLVEAFEASVPVYRKVPGLLRKYFVLDGAGRFGGVYLWASRADADRHHDPAWHDQARRRYGRDAEIEWFDTPILTPTRLAANRVAAADEN